MEVHSRNPLHLNDLFGNEIKKEIEQRWKLNKNRRRIKIKMKTE